MKIGTISLNINTNDLNYGAVMHSWAMQYYLINYLNVDTKVINYIPKHLVKFNYNFPFITYIKQNKNKQAMKNLLIFLKYRLRLKKFKQFISENFNTTELYNYFTLKDANLDFDKFICESDVIWSSTFCGGEFDDNFFLNFNSAREKVKIAYSPSLSDGKMNEIQEKKFAELIGNIDYISCRESYGVDIIKKFTDKNVSHVMDPVFLLDKNDYMKFIRKRPFKKKYLFLYMPVGLNKKMIKKAKIYAKENNLEIVEFTSSIHILPGYKSYYNKGIEDFLTAIYYADIVFTNSFHAICFSLLFSKEFYAFSRKAAGKVEDICKTFNLLDHYFSSDEFEEKNKIDYTVVEKLVEEKKNYSRKWLNEKVF